MSASKMALLLILSTVAKQLRVKETSVLRGKQVKTGLPSEPRPKVARLTATYLKPPEPKKLTVPTANRKTVKKQPPKPAAGAVERCRHPGTNRDPGSDAQPQTQASYKNPGFWNPLALGLALRR